MIYPESIAVVLPVHSRRQLTLACLRSLTLQSASGFKVIVVDSGSTDGTADAVEAEFPHAIVLRHSNLWWTGAINKGVERALKEGAEYVLGINDDLEFEITYISAMMRAAEQHPFAIFGSYLFDFDTRKPYYCGERNDWLLGRHGQLFETLSPEERRGLLRVSYYSGRGLWVPAELYRRLGLYDQKRLPHYMADVDFTARAAGRGYEVYVNCEAVTYNHREQSGALDSRSQFSWKNFKKHLFGIQGAGNLKNFTIFAFRHCPLQNLPIYWVIGIIRRVGGYLRDWLQHYLSVDIHGGHA